MTTESSLQSKVGGYLPPMTPLLARSSKTNAAADLIVDTNSSKKVAIVLSPIGKVVVGLPSFAAAFDQEKHAELNLAADKEDAKVSTPLLLVALSGGSKGA